MKILQVINIGYPAGGAETSLSSLCDELRRKGHEVRILSSDQSGENMFSDYRFKRIGDQSLWKFFQYLFYPDSYLVAKKAIKEFRPDIIHFHTIGLFSPSILFSTGNTPAVLTVHGPESFILKLLPWCIPANEYKGEPYDLRNLTPIGRFHYFYHRFLQRPLYLLGLRRVSFFIAPSTYVANIIRADVPVKKIVKINNGISLLSFKPLEKGHVDHTLLYAGRLRKFKGIEYLIRALPEIISEFGDVTLLLAGDGDQRNSLELLVNELNVRKNVTFLGHVSRQQLEAIYQKSSILVMPSTWPEVFGLVGIEAMSVGRPVVASDVGGVSDWLINGTTGFLVPPKDPATIADSVIRLFSDQNLNIKMGIDARKKVEEFSMDRHADQIEKMYLDAIKSNA